MHDCALQDLAFEGPEDDEPEVDVDVDCAGAVADETFGAGDEGVEAEAEADFVQNAVGVFGVYPVFDCAGGRAAQIGRCDLDDVRQCDLREV